MAKLDRKQPFAVVHGDDLGRRFEQNGKFFTSLGEEWVAPPRDLNEPASQADVQAAYEQGRQEAEKNMDAKIAAAVASALAGRKL
jgi:hypothetical protein